MSIPSGSTNNLSDIIPENFLNSEESCFDFNFNPVSQVFLKTIFEDEGEDPDFNKMNQDKVNTFRGSARVSLFGSNEFFSRKRKERAENSDPNCFLKGFDDNDSIPRTSSRIKSASVKKAKRNLGPLVNLKKEREFCFHDQQYKIKKIGSGQYHTVNKFEGEGTLQIEGQNLPLSKVVVKFLDGPIGSTLHGSNKNDEIDKTKKGYEQLKAIGVPVVEVYVEPKSKDDTDADTFWIVEKMDKEITGEAWSNGQSYDELDSKSQGILDFAKHWLTKRAKIEGEIYQLKEKLADYKNTEIEKEIAEKKSQIVFDFYRRNTMISEEGVIKIVDFGYVDDVDDFHADEELSALPKTTMICRFVFNWANKNEKIFDWLISDFPEDMKPEFSTRL